MILQEKIVSEERPSRPVLHLSGGNQGTTAPVLIDGETKSRDTRGPGMEGIPIRGTSVTPPRFWDSRSDLMWTPPVKRVEVNDADKPLGQALKERFGGAVVGSPETSDLLTFHVAESHIRDVLRFVKTETAAKYIRLDDFTALDESERRGRQPCAAYTGTVAHEISGNEQDRQAPRPIRITRLFITSSPSILLPA